MDSQTEHQFDIDDTEIENEEFKCCVCLELMYKPVVLACGHICCFWCVYRTMSPFVESNCPICRNPYSHFPNVCGLLHFVIKELYPIAYDRRELQVAEEEKKEGHYSPQIPENLSAFTHVPKLTSYENSSDIDNGSTNGGQVVDSSKTTISDKSGCSEVVSECQKNSEDSTSGQVVKDSNEDEDSCQCKALEKLFSVDFPCPGCKNILFRPVVLNCGHVHCEHCLCSLQNDNLKCQVCDSPSPNGLPKVCLVLDHLIAEHFQELYRQRRDSLLKQVGPANEGPSNSASQASKRMIKSEDYALWLTGRGPKVHIGAGCDYCGMSPILGERYRCIDCTEKIGFDLCETCYARSSVLPGRFNQQHRPDHRFEKTQPHIFNHVFIRPDLGESDDEDGYSSHYASDEPADDGPPSPFVPDAPPPL